MRRRLLLASCLAGTVAPTWAHETARGTAGGRLRCGADVALVDSGLARALQAGFSRDTGLPVHLVRAPALPLLDALAAGDLDIALTNTPAAEDELEGQGLIHDRHPIALGQFLLVGPPWPRGVESPPRGSGIAAVLQALAAAAATPSEALVFVSANDGSGAHAAEQAAWRLAGIAPQLPWYRAASGKYPLADEVRSEHAWAIVESGAWTARGGAPLHVHREGDPALAETVRAARAFRSPHPAAALFSHWIAGSRGHAVVARQRAYRVPAR